MRVDCSIVRLQVPRSISVHFKTLWFQRNNLFRWSITILIFYEFFLARRCFRHFFKIKFVIVAPQHLLYFCLEAMTAALRGERRHALKQYRTLRARRHFAHFRTCAFMLGPQLHLLLHGQLRCKGRNEWCCNFFLIVDFRLPFLVYGLECCIFWFFPEWSQPRSPSSCHASTLRMKTALSPCPSNLLWYPRIAVQPVFLFTDCFDAA